MNTSVSTHVGSSPLARGLLSIMTVIVVLYGIIPARAGFTAAAHQETSPHADHPRSRGVYPGSALAVSDTAGSSPLARGLRAVRIGTWMMVGIIPARAGFTAVQYFRHDRSQDHPRSRGVYYKYTIRCEAGSGSSPLARGLRFRRFDQAWGDGIIPARAGFTRS